jgi:putative DNA primase/helicase
VEPLRLDRLTDLRPLCEKAARWAADNVDALKVHDPEIPTGLYGRAADNWRPLLAIADVAGGTWPAKAREVALSMSATRSEQTAGILLLEDLHRLFDGRDRLKTDDILASLNAMEDRPWCEWNRGREMTAHGLSKQLKPFGVTPKQIRFPDGGAKGYELHQLQDAFSRYLTPSQTETPKHPADRAENRPSTSETSPEDVSDSGPSFLALQSQCFDVSDRKPPQEEVMGI